MPEGHITGDADLGVLVIYPAFSVGAHLESFQIDVISESEHSEGELRESIFIGNHRLCFLSVWLVFYVYRSVRPYL